MKKIALILCFFSASLAANVVVRGDGTYTVDRLGDDKSSPIPDGKTMNYDKFPDESQTGIKPSRLPLNTKIW